MNIALVLSGGNGTRAGSSRPKQYVEAEGKPAIAYCLAVFEKCGDIDAIQVVADENWHGYIRKWAGSRFKGFSSPGDTRQLSVLNGLADILRYADRSDTVIIHDAARPFVTDGLISACLDACRCHEGAMPVLPAKDTMYLHDGSSIASLVDRSRLCAGQAPEAYILGKYYDANAALLPDRIRDINGSTEPAVLAGMDVALVPGDEGNFKITTAEDLERFRRKCRERQCV